MPAGKDMEKFHAKIKAERQARESKKEKKTKERVRDTLVMRMNVEKLERMKVMGVKRFKNVENEAKYKPGEGLSYAAGAKELGLSEGYMGAACKKNPHLKIYRAKIMTEIWKEMQENATSIIADTLNRAAKGKNAMKMKDVERARIALDFKTKTDKQYNPTASIDVNFRELDIGNYDEMKKQIADELKLKIT